MNVSKLFRQFNKFAIVGIASFALDYGLMIILTEFANWDYIISCATSYIISVVFNYILSMRYVFSGKEGMSKPAEMAIFVALSFVGLAFNQMIMWVAVETFRIVYTIAKILATMVVTVYNFISRKVFLE